MLKKLWLYDKKIFNEGTGIKMNVKKTLNFMGEWAFSEVPLVEDNGNSRVSWKIKIWKIPGKGGYV